MLVMSQEEKVTTQGATVPVPLSVEFTKDDDGWYVAECVDLPGCMSQGRTLEEAKANILDAIRACVTVMLEDLLRQSVRRREDGEAGEGRESLTVCIPAPFIECRGAA